MNAYNRPLSAARLSHAVVVRTTRPLRNPHGAQPQLSARADIGEGWILGQQCGGLPTVELSSGRTPATCIAGLTLSTINCLWSRHRRLVIVHIEWDDLGAAAWQDIGEIGACTEHTAETSEFL
ncbi:hypothetical protein QF001_004991 [Paraburkholderia youngii]|uniref:hypothetical protein n=1 Tax=Paraburkholderia youngii TaxID=2782701 RepID=UPI003D1FBB3F